MRALGNTRRANHILGLRRRTASVAEYGALSQAAGLPLLYQDLPSEPFTKLVELGGGGGAVAMAVFGIQHHSRESRFLFLSFRRHVLRHGLPGKPSSHSPRGSPVVFFIKLE